MRFAVTIYCVCLASASTGLAQTPEFQPQVVIPRAFPAIKDAPVITTAEGPARAWPFDQLARQPVVNDYFNKEPVLVVFLYDSSTALVYDRSAGDRTLSFANESGKLSDRETGSQWDPASGKAIAGPLAGQVLPRAIGIVSYRRSWENFHPDSEYWRAGDNR